MAKHERFSSPPRAVGIPGQKPRLSMVDRQIAALRSEQERQRMAIQTREELFHELTDFSHIDQVDEYGLPFHIAYQIPDSVPDVLPVPKENVQTEEPKKAPEVTE